MMPEQTDLQSDPTISRLATQALTPGEPDAATGTGDRAGAAPIERISLSQRQTDRDRKRAALRELVDLAAKTAAGETRLDEQLTEGKARADKVLDRANYEASERVDALRKQVEQKHEDRMAKIAAEFDTAFAKIESLLNDKRRRAAGEYEHISSEIKQKYDQATWLAESVLEGVQNGLRSDSMKAKDEYATRNASLDELGNNAVATMARYGNKLIDVPLPEPQADIPDADAVQKARASEAERLLKNLNSLKLPKFFVGTAPYLIVFLVIVAGAAVAQWLSGDPFMPHWHAIGIYAGSGLGAVIAIGIILRLAGNAQVRKIYAPLVLEIDASRQAATSHLATQKSDREARLAHSTRNRNSEVQAAKDRYLPQLEKAKVRRDTVLKHAQNDYDIELKRLEAVRDAQRAEIDTWRQRHMDDLQRRYEHDVKTLNETHAVSIKSSDDRHTAQWADLELHWTDGLRGIQSGVSQGADELPAPLDWTDAAWTSWKPPKKFISSVRFGEFKVDLKQITEDLPKKLALPDSFSVPSSLEFPSQASLLIHTDHAGREEALSTLQMVMARLLTSLPPGRARFTIIDPVGLGQNFAGFMHLADHDDALVGGRIWTEKEHIEERLTNLTEHMETVIQKYLRNEFETIDDYNAQAGELAEPYRFLVIADFPTGFEGDAFRRLASIASSGARCGVYTLVIRDTRAALPADARLEEIMAHSVNLVRENGRFVWKDEVFQQFPLTIDAPPNEDALTDILDVVGRGAKDANRVEVPFESIAPQEAQFWSYKSASDLIVPIGRMGATRLQQMRLGRGVAQHALIAGKTGSGKSTLLHAIVTNIAMWYSPDEVEFYLVDFKKGVEFKTYATHHLPHARVIAVESDREFGVSVLQRLDAELSRRGEMFRKIGVQDLAAFRRESPGQVMPRTLLVIDEFQEFFSEDDKLAQDASVLLDRLVRQGRAFGIHVLLGSQTIAGSSGLPRSTIGQMAVRVALQMSEADSQLILGDANSAARLLSRPGEAIYNDAGGLVENNSPFQIAWLSDDKKDKFLDQVERRSAKKGSPFGPAIVFEGNAPAEIENNHKLLELIAAKNWVPTRVPQAWLGEPVAIKEPTAVLFRRQSGSNMLVIGQNDESSMALVAMSMVCLAAQQSPEAAMFVLMDGTPADSSLAGVLPGVAASFPHETKAIEFRAVGDAIAELSAEMARRQAGDADDAKSTFLIIHGLQRFRVLRKSDEGFSFSMGDEEKKPQPDKQFAELLRDGPAVGIHVIAWADTPASVDRTLDRGSMREFDNRILFQMSAADSSNLIDSPAANKLGFYRALAYSEEQGVMEKFRPYALPTPAWLKDVKQKLAR